MPVCMKILYGLFLYIALLSQLQNVTTSKSWWEDAYLPCIVQWTKRKWGSLYDYSNRKASIMHFVETWTNFGLWIIWRNSTRHEKNGSCYPFKNALLQTAVMI